MKSEYQCNILEEIKHAIDSRIIESEDADKVMNILNEIQSNQKDLCVCKVRTNLAVRREGKTDIELWHDQNQEHYFKTEYYVKKDASGEKECKKEEIGNSNWYIHECERDVRHIVLSVKSTSELVDLEKMSLADAWISRTDNPLQKSDKYKDIIKGSYVVKIMYKHEDYGSFASLIIEYAFYDLPKLFESWSTLIKMNEDKKNTSKADDQYDSGLPDWD